MQPHLLLVARNMLVNLLKQRHQFAHKRLSLGIEHFSVHRHLLFPEFHQRGIRFLLHLQQRISLLQRLVVVVQRLDIRIVVLRNHHIHQLSSLLASAFYERNIRR